MPNSLIDPGVPIAGRSRQMFNRNALHMAALAGILGACGGTRSPLVDSGVPDAGACDIDTVAQSLDGDGGIDCGVYTGHLGYEPGGDAGLTGGVACALAAQDAGVPFRLHLVFAGVDDDSESVFVRNSAGQSFELSDGMHLPEGSLVSVGEQGCASFSPTTYLGIPLADGGLPDLACDSPGASSTVCTYNWHL